MKAMILAAGFGERLRPHTLKLAKPAIPFLNIPMLSFPLYFLESLGPSELIINTHHLPKTVEDCVRQIVSPKYSFNLLHEEKEILGSGGGIENARDHLSKDNFIVANGDSILLPQSKDCFEKFWTAHEKSEALATLLVCPHALAGSKFGGVWLAKDNNILGFGKTAPEHSTGALHFTGFLILSPEVFEYLTPGPSNILYDTLTKAIAAGEKVQAYSDNSLLWFETGNSQDYLSATATCLELLAKNNIHALHLRNILSRFSPGWDSFKKGDCYSFEDFLSKKIKLPSQGLLGRNVEVDPSSSMEGFCIIGNQSQIGESCTLSNCVIGPNVIVGPKVNKKFELFL